ncbi:hypothetical protein RND81_03G018900 [Saponaria officinalis]|uniref:Uncharacterized protein n=1 Tax=Saponaria officinalis TaxID=3572 RepID=A0AAW1M2R6_SAPOF
MRVQYREAQRNSIDLASKMLGFLYACERMTSISFFALYRTSTLIGFKLLDLQDSSNEHPVGHDTILLVPLPTTHSLSSLQHAWTPYPGLSVALASTRPFTP